MRYRDQFDDDEDDEPKSSEFTLGVGSLLAIFFGMVLLCGLFFGFGYTLGHGKSRQRNVNPSAATPASTPAATSALTTSGVKPAAQQAAPPVQAGTGTAAAPTTAGTTVSTQSGTQPVQQNAAYTQQTTPQTQPAVQRVATPGAAQQIFQSAVPRTQSAMAATRHQYMVQVAAVSRPQDASVLISALDRRGFHAIARSNAQDNLMHIQLGPFDSLSAANQMRARLIADGYNAILKP